MFVVIGLGNPGDEYSATRHNAGFWVVEEFAKKSFGVALHWEKRFKSLVCRGKIEGQDVVLALPQTFMNRSGSACGEVLRFYKVEPEQCIVVHDDLDLPAGSLRIRSGGGAGGHNGISDIIEKLGSADFLRIRVGIGRPQRETSQGAENDVTDWVLGVPEKAEREVLHGAIQRAVDALGVFFQEGLEACQREFNKRSEPEEGNS